MRERKIPSLLVAESGTDIDSVVLDNPGAAYCLHAPVGKRIPP